MLEPKYIWNEREQDDVIIEELSQKHNISLITARLLYNRKILEDREVNLFLNPTFDNFHDPYLLKGMETAVDRIIKAKKNDEKLIIYGDYDVDGITSTSVLVMFMRECGFNVDYYIPNRLEEGYGINTDAIKKLKEQGTDLIVTVDTGITAVEQAKVCNELGMDMIITDHHEPQEIIPDAFSVIDPKQEDCPYPFKQLAGVGVAFKLMHALSMRMECVDIIWKYLDIVAVGTVADIVPLVNENRIFVKHAFETIPNTWNIGLKNLLEVTGYQPDQEISSGIIGFRVAPRLNAAGRLGDAARGVKLFISTDDEEAIAIAKELNEENLKRQALEQQIYDEAVDIIENGINVAENKILVVASEQWHHGVIGIVASRITEKYYRPSIILCVEDGVASGSARSVDGFSIFDAVYSCNDLMDKFGGHEMAAGMSLDVSKVEELQRRLNAYAENNMQEDTLIPKLKLDAHLPEKDVSLGFIDQIDALRPYGMGNPEPLFCIETRINEARAIGKEKNHLKLSLGYNNVDAIGFGIGEYSTSLCANLSCKVVGKLDRNEWKGVIKPQILLRDIHAYEDISEQVPKRKDFAMVYKSLVNYNRIYGNTITIEVLRDHIDKQYGEQINFNKIKNCLTIFKELELLNYEMHGTIVDFTLFANKKVDLEQSQIYQQLKNGV